MKSVYKFFWNFFAVFGICCMAGMIIMGVLVVKRYGGDGYRSLGTKILNKAGVDSLIVKKSFGTLLLGKSIPPFRTRATPDGSATVPAAIVI